MQADISPACGLRYGQCNCPRCNTVHILVGFTVLASPDNTLMSDAPGQWPSSAVPPRSAQDEVEMHSPGCPRLEVQLLISVHSGRSYPEVVGVAAVVVEAAASVLL